MAVLINPCIDGEYEDRGLTCSDCGKPATVKEYEIPLANNSCLRYRICKHCLDNAIVEINRALLNRRGIAPPYAALPTMELPVKEESHD